MKRIRIVAFVLAGFALGSLGCQPPAGNQAANSNMNTASNAKWDAYVEHFLNDYFAANPTFAVYQGKHEYDGKFPDWSADGLNNEIARLNAERERASAFKDTDLDEHQRFERDILNSADR